MTVDYIVGDTRDVTATIPDGSVSLVACSPPFIALRSYLPADHPDKDKEIGSEPDPATFLDTLLGLTAEWGRVLAPWGSIAIELGDTFSGSGGENNLYASGYSGGSTYNTQKPPGAVGTRGGEWPMAKSLSLVPQLYAASLAYGRNILTGQPSPAGQWRVRNMIVWHRPNPAVGALGDKYRPCTSYITVATRDSKRWFDLTAVRTPGSRDAGHVPAQPDGATQPGNTSPFRGGMMASNVAGAPPLDCWFDEWDGSHDTWTQTTQPSSLAHYAMWPAKLAERLILSMCPAEVCTFCREPRRRMVTTAPQAELRSALSVHIRTQREAKGLTVKELAAHFPSTSGNLTGCVWNWENNANVPTSDQWPTLKALIDLDDKFDAVINGERNWTELAAEYVGGQRGFTSDNGTGRGGHHGIPRATLRLPDLGWTDCACGVPFTPGTVLDPFAGTGTTLAVADLHGRNAIGIDIDARNHDLYPARRAEVARNLFGSPIPDPNQLDLFGAA